MSTPLGWARANVLYDSMSGVPEYGSLTEAVLLLVWKSRTAQGLAATRAVAQAAVGGEAAVEAFAEYRDLITKRTTESKKSDMREKLERLRDMQTVKFRPTDGGIGMGVRGGKKPPRLRTVRRKR